MHDTAGLTQQPHFGVGRGWRGQRWRKPVHTFRYTLDSFSFTCVQSSRTQTWIVYTAHTHVVWNPYSYTYASRRARGCMRLHPNLPSTNWHGHCCSHSWSREPVAMMTRNATLSGLTAETLPFYLKNKSCFSNKTLGEGYNGQIEGEINSLEHDIAFRNARRSCYQCKAGTLRTEAT